MKLKGLCERVYRHLDGDLIGKHLALKLSKDYDKIFIFTDEWSKNKKIQIDKALINIKRLAFVKDRSIPPNLISGPILWTLN